MSNCRTRGYNPLLSLTPWFWIIFRYLLNYISFGETLDLRYNLGSLQVLPVVPPSVLKGYRSGFDRCPSEMWAFRTVGGARCFRKRRNSNVESKQFSRYWVTFRCGRSQKVSQHVWMTGEKSIKILVKHLCSLFRLHNVLVTCFTVAGLHAKSIF